jgi:hypothetical protein
VAQGGGPARRRGRGEGAWRGRRVRTMIAGEYAARAADWVERHFEVAALTLIEAALKAAGLTGAQSRRQVVGRSMRLSELVGRRSIGATFAPFPAPEPLQAGFGDELPLGAPLGPRNMPQNGQAGIPTRADKTRCQRR